MLLAILTTIAIASCGSKKILMESKLTEPLETSAWGNSQWISVADAPVVTGSINDIENGRAADGANWFVSMQKNDKRVVSAKWMTAGLGVYELYVNGQLVGDEVLKPGFTHNEKTKRTFTYNVTPLMKTKTGEENQFAVQVTPGWWGDKIVTPGGHEGMIGKKCAFRGVLELTFADGTKQRYGTNEQTWKAGIAGPVKHAAIFDGEEYDAREPLGYEQLERLSKPEVNTEYKGELLPNNGAEIYFRNDLELKPIQAYIWKDVEGAKEDEYGKVKIERNYARGESIILHKGETLVVDFGQNCAAVPSFVFKAARGTVLTCLPAELLNDGNGAKSRGMDGPEGSCHRDNLRSATIAMRMVYTFAGKDGFEQYQPRYTFFGYRYVSITASDDVEISAISSIPVSSISQKMEIGKLTTGNKLVNQLISNTLWGQRSNYLSIPTDCPQRNERLGWMADTQVFAETGTYFANTLRFFHKWMRDVRDSQSKTGGYPGVAPFGQYGNDHMRLGWADAGIIVPWTIWKQFGDQQIIDESWSSMERYMDHIDAVKYNHEALRSENGNYQWADWLSYEPLETCTGKAFRKDGPLPESITYWNYLSACYWAIDASMMADMAKASGQNSAKYEEMTMRAKTYLKEQFLNADGTFKCDILNTMQTPALFAMKIGLVEGQALEDTKIRLRKNFEEHGGCLQTGFLGTSILMETLSEHGMNDVAYELLFQRKNPSWLYSVDNGATTIWERWNSYMKDKGMGPQGMNSFNHYAYGCVCQWLWQRVAGIATDKNQPGFKHIVMKPIPDRRLGHVDATYESASGTIKSAWKYEGDQWIWEFSIPKGATASVTLPGETISKEYGSGNHKVNKRLP
ncbi:MAG: glycoside hydrolase family 78 protein [Prevotella sp.]|nr:glycoside hydrolase family 78 protein [Prevotella sp.]